jgi:hypothetical protein
MGLCSCSGTELLATTDGADTTDKTIADLKWKIEFAQKRFANLVGIVNRNVDEATRKRIWESLGREHAKEFRDLTNKYRGDLKGFLAELRRQWVETADYDERAGTIRIVDRSPVCTCPLVRRELTPADFCACTLGWQKEAYSAVVGRPVEATLEESILRGGKRCVFRIRIV